MGLLPHLLFDSAGISEKSILLKRKYAGSVRRFSVKKRERNPAESELSDSPHELLLRICGETIMWRRIKRGPTPQQEVKRTGPAEKFLVSLQTPFLLYSS